MKKLAIIPSRYESSRFPGKPLIDLAGKSMIQRVYEGVRDADLFDKIVVATDDDRILSHVLSFGGEGMLTKKAHESGTERCGEVIEKYTDYEIVVNIQGDEPLVNAVQLQELLTSFEDESVQIATLGTLKITQEDIENPNRIKIVTNYQSDGIYFSRSPIPYERNAQHYPFLKHIGLYGFRASVLRELIALPVTKLEVTESLEQLKWLYYGYPIRVALTEIETPNIDVPEDVAQVLEILKKADF